jgi:hypothetical protein
VPSAIATGLKSLAGWRASVERSIQGLARWMQDHELHGETERVLLQSLRQRLQAERLLVAVVAEFSRGKSELINAIFFGDTGRRILPATPGRTTMCPVELFHDAGSPPSIALLPIETRLRGLALADLRQRDEPWNRIALDPSDTEGLARALGEVTRTSRVSVDDARALGLWDDENPDDNPPRGDDALVEVPAWRHALINYPHPLLKRGLVVLDTPGLNAIGAEPELTLGLLPSAHATVFVLAADTGVTRSDLAIWRDHLGARALERFVVLNKVDTLADPLLTPQQVAQQVAQQREQTARTLGIPPSRVFPLSARDALAARLAGDADALAASGLPALEAALSLDLLPRQQELLLQAVVQTLATLRAGATRRLSDRRRHNAEELLELRGLRGKSGAKVRLMLQRVDAETEDFERCTARLAALRAVQTKQLRQALAPLSSDVLRIEVAAMQPGGIGRLFGIGAAKAFGELFVRLRAAVARSRAQADEMAQMLEASYQQLNAEFGYTLARAALPDAATTERELALIESRYSSYLGLAQAWKLAAPGAMEQFRRMLLSKLRVVFENASGEIEIWARSQSVQVDAQLRERRRAFSRRRDALERIQGAAGELERRLADLERHDESLRELQQRLDEQVAAVERAAAAPADDAWRRDAA